MDVAARPGSTCPISPLTRPASACLPTSRPSVTQYTRPRNRRSTRRSARTIFATVVLPNPPAPCTAVVMPTVPAERRSAATIWSTSAGRSTTHGSGRCTAGTSTESPRSYRRCAAHTSNDATATAAVAPAVHHNGCRSTGGNHLAVPPVATFTATASTVAAVAASDTGQDQQRQPPPPHHPTPLGQHPFNRVLPVPGRWL